MAAERRLRLKLKYSTRFSPSASSKPGSPTVVGNIMEMAADTMMHTPTFNASEQTSSPFPLNAIRSLSSSQNSMPLAAAPIGTARRRRLSKGMTGAVIKRSASTPNVRGLAASEAAMSLADKRRSKLGYHRTSVACVHCRRRKIRCLLAPDDHQNRCLNCIRLKKECNFYPVDQQPPVERRPRTGSKTEGGSGDTSASSSSSPGFVGGHIIEQVEHFNPYHSLSVGHQDFSGSLAPLSAGILSPPASAAPRGFGFSHHPDRSHWESTFFEHGPFSGNQHAPDDHSNNYWKATETPMTPAFSPFSAGSQNPVSQHPPDVGTSFVPYGGSRQDQNWPLPGRSHSFGHVEDLSHAYPNHPTYHRQQYQLDFRRRASEMQPRSLETSGNSSSTSMSEAPNAPLSAPVTSQPMHHFGLTPAWHAIPGHSPVNKAAEFGGWYSEPSQLAKVQEEESGPHFSGDTAILYSNARHR